MAKLIIFKPDGSIADIFSIPDSLALELSRVLEYSERESLDLALLREIKLRALSVVSRVLKEKNIKIDNPEEIQAFAIYTLDWFISLLDVIYRIGKLPNSESLTLNLSN